MRSKLGLLFGFVAVSTVAAATACGSSSSPEVFDTDGGASGEGGTSGGDGAASSGDGAGGANPTSADGGTVSEAGPGGNTSSLTCGAASCSIPGQTCCVTRVAQSSYNLSCVNGTSCPAVDAGAGTDPTRPTALQCTSSSNCATGEVCCVSLTQAGAAASCKTPGACANAGGGDTAVLCDPTQPTVGCPSDQPCSSKNIQDWRLPSGFGTCGGKGN